MRSEKPPEENELDVLDGYVLGRLAYVIDHLESYQGLDGKGGVIVHPPSKRKFEWAKSIREIVQSEQAPFVTESYQILRCPFYQYFHGINSDIATQEIALEALENWILPRVEVIREELNCLIGLLKSIGRKRVAKLERMQKDLEESEPFIWDTFVTHFEQSVKQEARSAGLQFEKQALNRLVIGLYDILWHGSTLTKENAFRHILGLLEHFEIQGPLSMEALRKMVAKGRTKQIRKDYELAVNRLHEYIEIGGTNSEFSDAEKKRNCP